MNNRGVTLIELLITIVVLGIISVFAVPSVSNIISNSKRDKVLNAAIIVEESARQYCTLNKCDTNQVLTKTELSELIDKEDSTYTYTATLQSDGSFSVKYTLDGKYSFPVNSNGELVENVIPTSASRDLINILGEGEGNEEPEIPVIPEGEPYVLLNGSSTVYVEIASSYTDPGAVGYASNGSTISNVWTGGSVNFWALGTYTRTYNCYSSYDNKNCIGAERTIVVQDTTPPVITVNGGLTVTRPVGSWYSENGAWAIDNSNEQVTVTRGGDTVDINTVGTYYVTYTSTDSSGNTTTVTKTVIVE